MCLPPPPSPHNVEEAIFKQTSQDSHFKRCNEFLKNIMVYIILYFFFFFEQEEVKGRKKKKKKKRKGSLPCFKWGCLFNVEGWEVKVCDRVCVSVCVCVCVDANNTCEGGTLEVKGARRGRQCSED